MQPNEINIFKIARLVGPAGRQQMFSQMEPRGSQQTGEEGRSRSMHSGYDDRSTHAAILMVDKAASALSCDTLEK